MTEKSKALPAGFELIEESASQLPAGFELISSETPSGSSYAPIPEVQHTPMPEQKPVPYGVGLANEAVQGATFGLSDEIMAGMDAATGQNYNPEQYREISDQFSEENPKAAFAAQLTGGIATGGYGAAKALGSQAVKQAPRVMRALSVPVVGGVEGAIAGAGYAKEGERQQGAIESGARGLGIGAVIPAGGYVGKKVWDYGLGQITRAIGDRASGATTAAGREIMRALDDVGISPNQAISRLRTLGKDATLADIIPQLGENAAAVGGKATSAAERTFGQRVAGQADRVVDKVDDLLTNVGVFSEGAKVTARRAAQAKEAYKSAYQSNPIMISGEITELLQHKTVQGAIKRARINPDYKNLPDHSIELLDAAYKEIGAMARKPGAPHALKSLRSKLREAMVSENPDYGAALVKFADDSRVLDALDEGKKLFRLRPEQIKRTLADMGETEAEAYRVGAADAIKDKILSAPDAADVVKRIFGSPKSRAQLGNVFPNRKSFRAFELEMKREALKAKTSARVLANSRTAIRESGKASLGSAPGGVVQDLVTGHPLRATGKAVGQAIQKMQAPNRRVTDQLSDVLYNKNMPENWDYLVGLSNKAQRQGQRQLPAKTQALVNALMGGTVVQR